MDARGQRRDIRLEPLVAGLTCRGPNSTEFQSHLPSELLRNGLGIVDGLGNHMFRSFITRDRIEVANWRDVAHPSGAQEHCELLVGDAEKARAVFEKQALVPVWFVRVHREGAPRLRAEGSGAMYQDRYYCVVGSAKAGGKLRVFILYDEQRSERQADAPDVPEPDSVA